MSILMGIIQVVLFFIALITAFFIPGRVTLGKKTFLSGTPLIICSVVVGIVLWGVQGWIFGYVHLRWLSYIYLVGFLGYFLWQKGYALSASVHEALHKKIDWIALGIAAVGLVAQNINYFRMGWITKSGMILNSFNVGDHIWHAALTNEIVQRFPPDEPGMYGILVKNYHFWFNLVTGEVVRVFHLPLFPTQFIGMYMLGSILLGFCAYLVVTTIYPSKTFLRLVLFLLYMGGDAMGWLTLITTHTFLFAGQRIEDATIFMDNPPRAFSVIVVLTGTYLLFLSLKKPTIRLIIIMAFLFGTAVGFKVYTGIVFLLALALLIGYKMIRREFSLITLGALAAAIAATIFIPVNAGSGGLFFVPFDLPRDFVAQPQFGLHDWELRWRIYWAHNNYLRLFQYGIYMTGVYLFAQYGIKLLGIIPLKRMRQILGAEKVIFLYGVTIAGLILGIFFYQHAGTANIFNFFIIAALPLTFLSALQITLFLEKKALWIKVLVLLLVVGFVIPRFIFANYTNIYQEFLTKPAYISSGELAADSFLSKVPVSSWIMVVHNRQYDYDIDTPIVSLLSNRHMFLSGAGIIDSHGALSAERVQVAKTIENSIDAGVITNLLYRYNIDYLYFYGTYSLQVPQSALPVKVAFQNTAITILHVIHK